MLSVRIRRNDIIEGIATVAVEILDPGIVLTIVPVSRRVWVAEEMTLPEDKRHLPDAFWPILRQISQIGAYAFSATVREVIFFFDYQADTTCEENFTRNAENLERVLSASGHFNIDK